MENTFEPNENQDDVSNWEEVLQRNDNFDKT